MDSHQRKSRFDQLRNYCLSFPGVSEDMPFDDTTLVFKVAGKIFLLTRLEGDLKINLKCDPDLAMRLREEYDGTVHPGYHMNKKHWNTIDINGSISDDLIYRWIDHSYQLVVSSLPIKTRKSLGNTH